MQCLLKSVITALAVLYLLQPASAQVKLTSNPFSAGTKAAENSDSRLAQKITYEARRSTVHSILSDLTSTTGVVFLAGWNEKDWPTRDCRVTVCAKDMSISELMESMARVMQFKWTRSGEEGRYTYRLYTDPKTLEEAEAKLQEARARLAAWQTSKREELLPVLDRWAAMTPSDLEQAKATDPYMYWLSKSGLTKSLSGLLSSVPEAKQAWLSAQDFTIYGNTLPPQARNGIQSFIDSLDAQLAESVAKNPKKPAPPRAGPASLDDVCISLQPGGPLGVRLDIGWPADNEWGKSQTTLYMADPESPEARRFARQLSAQDSADTENSVDSQSNSGAPNPDTDLGEPLIVHQDAPWLSTKIKVKSDIGILEMEADVQLTLAKESQISIISDCYDTLVVIPNGEYTIKSVLGKLESCRYNWEKRGAALTFRHRDWYRLRTLMIPEEWLESWRRSARETDTIAIDSLADMATLTTPQFVANIGSDEVLGKNLDLITTVSMHKDLLAWYAGLSKAERAALFSDTGLYVGTNSPALMTLTSDCLGLFSGSLFAGNEWLIQIRATSRKVGKQYEYKFVIDRGGSVQPLIRVLRTPLFYFKAAEQAAEKKDDVQKPKSGEATESTTAPLK